eukprot:358287-Chlamydomonas_euryale.AAC.10
MKLWMAATGCLGSANSWCGKQTASQVECALSVVDLQGLQGLKALIQDISKSLLVAGKAVPLQPTC